MTSCFDLSSAASTLPYYQKNQNEIKSVTVSKKDLHCLKSHTILTFY